MVVPLIAAGARVAGKTALKGGSRAAGATARGVQNTQKFSTERPTVRSDFKTSKSLQAKVQRGLEARGKGTSAQSEFTQQRKGGRRAQGAVQGNTNQPFIQKASSAADKVKTARTVASSAPLLYWISGTLSFLIFFFGIACLAFVAAGKTGFFIINVDDIVNLISFGSFKISDLGMVCWVLTLVLALVGHLGIALFAMLALGIRFLDHQSLFLMTTVSLAGSILPVLQLIPWMVLWVVAIQAHALLQAKKQ